MRCAARFFRCVLYVLYTVSYSTLKNHTSNALASRQLYSPPRILAINIPISTLSLSPVIIPKLHNLPRRIAPIDTKLTARLVKLRLKISDFIPILIAEDRITEAAYRRDGGAR